MVVSPFSAFVLKRIFIFWLGSILTRNAFSLEVLFRDNSRVCSLKISSWLSSWSLFAKVREGFQCSRRSDRGVFDQGVTSRHRGGFKYGKWLPSIHPPWQLRDRVKDRSAVEMGSVVCLRLGMVCMPHRDSHGQWLFDRGSRLALHYRSWWQVAKRGVVTR